MATDYDSTSTDNIGFSAKNKHFASIENLNDVNTTLQKEVTDRNTAIKEAVNDLNVDSVGQDGQYINSVKEEAGLVATTSKAFSTELSDDATTAPTTASVFKQIGTKDATLSDTGFSDLWTSVKTLVANIAAKVSFKVVSSKDVIGTEGYTDKTVIYLVANGTKTDADKYSEYIYDGTEVTLIGETSVDLSEYVNTLDSTAVGNYVTSITKDGNKMTLAKGSFSTAVSSTDTANAPTGAAVATAISNVAIGTSKVILIRDCAGTLVAEATMNCSNNNEVSLQLIGGQITLTNLKVTGTLSIPGSGDIRSGR